MWIPSVMFLWSLGSHFLKGQLRFFEVGLHEEVSVCYLQHSVVWHPQLGEVDQEHWLQSSVMYCGGPGQQQDIF